MPIKHEHILNPITAVEFCQNGSGQQLILAGEGSFLKVFEAGSCKLLRQCEIFHGQAIHGIAVQETPKDDESLKLVIWGGPCLVTLRNHELEQLLTNGIDSLAKVATSASDWIMDVALSPEDPNSFALVTAHNTVLQARLQIKSGAFVLEIPSSPSRSILYSAHLIWDSPSSLLVAAGTVFGEIIAWKCDLSGRSEVLHTFTGHEGSIFGVNISDPVTFPDKTVGRLLASCSDDRTIRVWKLASEAVITISEHDNLLLRETGFGDNQLGDKSAGYESLATAMGHASRIWGVKFLVHKSIETTHNNISVLSFGEDSTTQHWALDFGQDGTRDSNSQALATAKLVQLETLAFHSGKHIWSTALRPTSQSNFTIVTGGADGKISMYDIGTYPASKTCETISTPERDELSLVDVRIPDVRPDFWDLEDILKSCSPQTLVTMSSISEAQPLSVEQPPVIDPETGKPAKKVKAKKIPKDALNRYGFLSEDQVLMTTTFGRVFLGNINNHVEWQEIFLPDETPNGLRSYALVTGFPELGLSFLAGANGKVYIYQKGSHLREVADVGFKVADMFKISDSNSNAFELLVTTLGGQIGTLLSLDVSSPDKATLEKKSEYQLPERFVVTSAGKVGGLLALGSRAGSMALYAQEKPQIPLHVWTPAPTSSPESITTIIPISSVANPGASTGHILTTDRDGKYSIFSCSTSQDLSTTDLRPIHHGHPPFGPMIEAAWFSGPSQDLILYGFKGKNFIVWNESQHYEITNVDCGGAHRSYAYSPRSQTGGGHFVYTKASKLYIHTQTSPSHTIVKTGGHGREIKACAISTDLGYIATAAEDTEIRLWSYESNSAIGMADTLKCKATAQKHTAGIQHLQFHKKYLFSSGGNEEFYVWALSPIPGLGLGIMCEAAYPDQSPDCDLRIMGFDVCAFPGGEGTVLISLAFSDSTIKCYAYSEEAGFQLVAKGRYTSSCLMQIKHIKISSEEICLATAATDGKLILWKAPLSPSRTMQPTQLEVISSRKVHQSSIKALDLLHVPTANSKSNTDSATKSSRIILATGGDDNALGISIYTITNLSSPPQSFVLRSAHAAAVTGISFVPSSKCARNIGEGGDFDAEYYKVVSSSNDQRVKEWEVVLSRSKDEVEAAAAETDAGNDKKCDMQIKLQSDAFTAVADVSDLAVLASGAATTSAAGADTDAEANPRVLVVGNGMEIYAVSV